MFEVAGQWEKVERSVEKSMRLVFNKCECLKVRSSVKLPFILVMSVSEIRGMLVN